MSRTKEFDPEAAVDAAVEVFWRQGYAATTPQHLVDALGIGRGSLYNAFGSKQALFERALRRYVDLSSAAVAEVLGGPGSPRARIHAAVSLVLRLAKGEAGRQGCMVTNTAVEFGGRPDAGGGPDASARRSDSGHGRGGDLVALLVRRAFERQEAAFRGAVEEGQLLGEIDPALDPSAMAALFVATGNGIQVIARADPSSPLLDRLADTVMLALGPDLSVSTSQEKSH